MNLGGEKVRILRLFGGLLSLALIGAAPNTGGISAPVSSGASDVVSQQLKSALIDSQKKLPQLEPWQKKVFDEEILTQYQRFIRDYRPTGNGLSVEVDTESLKRYLNFRPKTNEPKALVYLRADPACGKCLASYDEIKTLVKDRMERHGFVPVWMTPEEVGDSKLTGKSLNERVMTVTQAKNLGASMVVQWQIAPIDDIDTAHADEEHFLIRTFFGFKDSFRSEGQLELLSTDNFPTSAVRLLTDAFTELGSKIDLADLNPKFVNQDEITVDVTGIRDYAQFAQVKTQIQTRLKEVTLTPPEERKLSRGRASFAVFTRKTLEEVKGLLSGPITLSPGMMALTGVQERSVQMEVR